MGLRQPVRRKLLQWMAFAFTNGHLENFLDGRLYRGPWKEFCSPGLNCYSCPAAGLACPIGAMQAVAGTRGLYASFYVLGFLMAVGLFLGRAVCGFLCPFGLLQELLHKIPFPKRRLWHPLIYAKYVALAVLVLFLPAWGTYSAGIGAPAYCEYVCPAGMLEGGLPLLATHPEYRQAVGALFAWKASILVATVIGCMMVYRFFCKALCPLGAIYGLMNRISLYRLRVDMENCISCGRCRSSCKMEVDPLRQPDSAECIRCGECANACPKGAISLGIQRIPADDKTFRNPA